LSGGKEGVRELGKKMVGCGANRNGGGGREWEEEEVEVRGREGEGGSGEEWMSRREAREGIESRRERDECTFSVNDAKIHNDVVHSRDRQSRNKIKRPLNRGQVGGVEVRRCEESEEKE
jgi:hypothetical protein